MTTIPPYHASVIAKFPAGEWVKPYNSATSDDNTVFSDLYEWGLVEKRVEFHYRGSSLAGASVYYKYQSIS